MAIANYQSSNHNLGLGLTVPALHQGVFSFANSLVGRIVQPASVGGPYQSVKVSPSLLPDPVAIREPLEKLLFSRSLKRA